MRNKFLTWLDTKKFGKWLPYEFIETIFNETPWPRNMCAITYKDHDILLSPWEQNQRFSNQSYANWFISKYVNWYKLEKKKKLLALITDDFLVNIGMQLKTDFLV